MTEDIWDELWEDIDWNRVTTIPFITERIHKIKAEGDKLKEKAEKWDRLDQPAKYNLTKYMECSDKLEAIKTLTLDYHKDEQLIHPIKLLKILEAKE